MTKESVMHDVIGDTHGHSSRLALSLECMGYERGAESWRHANRHVSFEAGFIKRCREQIEAFYLVRSRIDRGAVLGGMGNHESNAVLKKPDPDQDGERPRPHTDETTAISMSRY